MNGFFSNLFGRTKTQPDSFPSSRSHQSSIQDESENATKAQLVQVTMRDVLRKSGIPPGWIECQIYANSSRSRGHGLYLRLVIRHWDDRLMQYTFAFQNELRAAIVQFEPKAEIWLQGISWQLDVLSTCPYPALPHRDTWLEAPVSFLNSAQGTPPTNVAVPVVAPVIRPAVEPVLAPVFSQLMPTAMSAVAIAAVVSEPVIEAMASAQSSQALEASKPNTPLFELDLTAKDLDAVQDLERLFAIRDNELANLAANDLLPAGYENTEPAPL